MSQSFEQFCEAVKADDPQEFQERKLGDGKFLKRIFDAAERAGVLDALMAALLNKIGGPPA